MFGKLKEGPHGLLQQHNFEQAIAVKPKEVVPRKFKYFDIYNSLAFQSLIGSHDAIETEQEPEMKKAQLKVLMARGAKEYPTPVPPVE